MKVLLMGGTGAMGSHLASVLTDRGEKVVVTTRKQKEAKGLVEYRTGNAKDLIFLRSVLQEKWDAIVDFMVYSENAFKDRIDLLLDSTAQYVFLSSSRVYNNSHEPITEESPRLLDSTTDKEFLSTSEYSLSKARQEDILHSTHRRNWTIVRPYITYSEKRLQLGTLEKEDWLYRALKGKPILFSKDMLDCFTTLTYGKDVANGIARLINNPSSFGEAFHITSERAYKWCDIIDIYLDVLEDRLGCRPRLIYQDLPDFLSCNSGKYQIIYDRLFKRVFDNTKIKNYINTEAFTPAEVGLRNCLNEFILRPEFLSINGKKEAIKDRFTKDITPLSEFCSVKEKIKYIVYRYLLFFDLRLRLKQRVVR